MKSQQAAMERAAANAVKAALFTFGRADAKEHTVGNARPRRRTNQWMCSTCKWDNDMKRPVCRHCGKAKAPTVVSPTTPYTGSSGVQVPRMGQSPPLRGVWANPNRKAAPPEASAASAHAIALEQAAACAKRAGAASAEAL
eukprot:1745241-Karenia_brevis.AAC.1